MHPLTRRRYQVFKSNTRAYISLWLLIFICLISLITPFLANDKPLIVFYQGKLMLPQMETVTDQALGGDLPTEADFSDPETIQSVLKEGLIVKAPIAYAADTVDYFSPEPFPAAPSGRHWLGTDDQGRDLLSRLLYAVRLSLLFGFALTILSALLGIAVGAIQGYFGGVTDLVVGRFLEIWSSLPQLFILIIISSLIAPSFLSILIILLLFGWTQLTGVVRAEFLKTRNLDYVKAARILGVSDFRIMLRHILPNALVASITYIPFMLSGAIVSLTALDFLGLGLPPGTPSLGELVRQGKENLQAPWIGLTVFITLSCLLSLLIFIGEGVRDAFDPHRKPSRPGGTT